MHYSLPFGFDAKLELDLPPDVTVNNLVRPIAAPLEDPAAVVMANLQQPLNYPPLAAATVSGDLVAIAVEPGLPQVEVLVASALYQLLEAGTNPHNISVVIASNRR
ncbi:MAG TPA: hypothetical protein VL096_22100, partial [Pirellulaceae bacterium]|nr:hypothetical protein [Pirellulaceae bacterium]